MRTTGTGISGTTVASITPPVTDKEKQGVSVVTPSV